MKVKLLCQQVIRIDSMQTILVIMRMDCSFQSKFFHFPLLTQQ